MDHAPSFASLQDDIQNALISATRTVSQISSEDLKFQRSLNPSIGTALDEQSARLLALSSSLLKSAASISEVGVPVLGDSEDVDLNWRGVVDVVDSLLEKADTCLDEYTGVIKRKTPPTTEQSPSKLKKYQPLSNSFRTQNIAKPQLSFLNKPNNTTTTPWKPFLTSKPHATIPLAQSLGTFTDELQHLQYDYTVFLPLLLLGSEPQNPEGLSKPQRQRLAQKRRRLSAMGTSSITNGQCRYKHPYETEILEMQYPGTLYHKADPIPSQDVKSAKATFVDTFDGVLAMLAKLKEAKEIAIDLEHHDTRSYVGLVSLMQISTRKADWIVDTLKPWREDLQILNEVFADPKIIKVFHGAYMDIVWLQRDLGLYVVGLFDTHHASKTLGYPGGSLAYLLKRFVNFDADKKYQMADWRIRPLPEEMFFYAQTDTHFLLYIFDNLRNELVERSNPASPEENRIELTLQKSKETSLLRFERQIYDRTTGKGPAGWYNLLVKTPPLLGSEQFAVFRAVHAWRDQVAREDDDSIHYVMPNQVVFTLAKLMPTDMVSLYGAVHPISHSVKPRTVRLLELIRSARATGENGPSMVDVLHPNSVGTTAKANSTSAAPSRILAPASNETRTDSSVFWGRAFGSSVWDSSSVSFRNRVDLSLAVPMPPLATSPTTTDRALHQEDSIQASPNKSGAENDEAAFVLKTPSKEEKKLFKAAKKHEKAQKKLASAVVPHEEEEAFDYANADSVLHKKRKFEKLEKEPFDPYTKSSDAPKGMRRLKTELPGKSVTFRS